MVGNFPSEQERSPQGAPFSLCAIFTVAVLLLAGLGFLIYYPGLNSPFMLDDYPNFGVFENFPGKLSLDGVLLYFSMDTSSAIGRTVSIASFLLNKSDWPDNPFGFKLINLVIHLINFGLVAILLYRLQRLISPLLCRKTAMVFALAFSVVWLLSPMQTTTVYYAVQRIAQLSALFSLLAIHAYLSFRASPIFRVRMGALILMGMFMAFDFLSKENSFLIFIAYSLIEIYIFKWHGSKALRTFLMLFAALPSVVIIGWMLLGPIIHTPDYSSRSFTMEQRLLTQVYCLKDYFFQFVFPDVSRISVFHDDLSPVKSVADLRFATGLLFFVVAGWCIYFFFNRNKLISFGLAWFFAWHSVEASAVPLELYFEHRNYLPSVGIVMALLGGTQYLQAAMHGKSKATMLVAGVGVYLLALGTLTYLEAGKWEHPVYMASRWIEAHPDSLRAKEFHTSVLRVFGIKLDVVGNYRAAAKRDPNHLTPLLLLKLLSCLDGKAYVDESQYRDFKPKEIYELAALTSIHNIITMAETKSCKVPIDMDTYETLLNRYAERPDMKPQLENIYLMLQRIAKLEGDYDREKMYFERGYKSRRTAMYGFLYYARLRAMGRNQEARDLLLDLKGQLSHHWLPVRNIFGYLYITLVLEQLDNQK